MLPFIWLIVKCVLDSQNFLIKLYAFMNYITNAHINTFHTSNVNVWKIKHSQGPDWQIIQSTLISFDTQPTIRSILR
jgi:hypothetical protein